MGWWWVDCPCNAFIFCHCGTTRWSPSRCIKASFWSLTMTKTYRLMLMRSHIKSINRLLLSRRQVCFEEKSPSNLTTLSVSFLITDKLIFDIQTWRHIHNMLTSTLFDFDAAHTCCSLLYDSHNVLGHCCYARGNIFIRWRTSIIKHSHMITQKDKKVKVMYD